MPFYGDEQPRPSPQERDNVLEAYRKKLRDLLKSADELDEDILYKTRALIDTMKNRIVAQTARVTSLVGQMGMPDWGQYSWLPHLQRAHNFVVDEIAQQFGVDLKRFTVRGYQTGVQLADQGLHFATQDQPGLNVLSSPMIDPEQLKLSSGFSADLITKMSQAQKDAIGREVALSLALGESPGKLMARLEQDLPSGPWETARYRAEVIARTETARVQELGRQQRMEQQQRANPTLTIYRQFLVAPVLKWPCRMCARFDGYVWAVDGTPYIPADGQRAPDLPLHPNCFIDGTPVLPVGKVEAAYRRFYDGPVVEMFLSSDSKPYLTVTPNHPILTQRGWVPAGELQPSDSLVYCPDLERAPSPTTMGHIKHPYVRIEEVFQALSQTSLIQRVPGLSMQFHGDGQEGEVEIIRADLELAIQAVATLEHLLEKPFLCLAHSRKVALAGAGRILPPGFGSGALSALSSHLSRHLGLANPIGLASTANLSPCSFQRPANYRATDTEKFGNSEFRHLLFDIKAEDLPSQVSILLEFGLADLLPLRKLRRKRFVGHVNNLQTSNGFYAAAGIPVSNCRCTYIPWVPHLSPVPVIRPEDNHASAGNAVAQWDTVAVAWSIVFPDDARTVVRMPSRVPQNELDAKVRWISQQRGHPYNELVVLRAGEVSKPAATRSSGAIPDAHRAINKLYRPN